MKKYSNNMSIFMVKVIGIIFIVSSLFMFEKSLGIQHWQKDYFQLSSPKEDGSFILKIKFFDYEFGPFGEHGFLRWCDIGFSTDFEDYAILLECLVGDQVYSEVSKINLKNEFKTALIMLMKPEEKWFKYRKAENVSVYNNGKQAYLEVNCSLENNKKIKDLRITGEWRVNGVYCVDHIFAQEYLVPEWNPLNLEGETELKKHNIQNALLGNQIQNKEVKVYKEAEAIVIKGVEQGQNIRIYSLSGSTVISSFMVNSDVTKVVLPINQMYIVNIGQAYCKVAL